MNATKRRWCANCNFPERPMVKGDKYPCVSGLILMNPACGHGKQLLCETCRKDFKCHVAGCNGEPQAAMEH